MPPATARLEARISAELHATLKRAAELQDRTMTDFVIAAVQDAAQRAIEKAGVISLFRSPTRSALPARWRRRRRRMRR